MLDTIVSAATEAVFGYLLEEAGLADRVRARLKREPARLAFQAALVNAYTAFARHYPQWTESLFDQTFLTREDVAAELSKFLTRHRHPDPAAIAHAWAAYFPAADPDRREARVDELTPIVACFLDWLEAELKAQEALQPLFDSRALERLPELAEDVAAIRKTLTQALERAAKYQVVVRQAQGLVIGDHAQVTQVFHTYFGADYVTLKERYISPEPVFDRVKLDRFAGRQWLEAELDAFLNAPNRDRGVWLLVGEAGVGKTTFLAHLVQTRGYLHLFAEQAPGKANLRQALGSLAVQLVSRYRLEPYARRDTLPQDLIEAPHFFERLLRAAAEQLIHGERLVIVIDALDEAGALPDQNVLNLPKVLPRGVYLILSQRPVPVPLRVDAPLERVELQAESEENRRDVKKFLGMVSLRPEIAGQLRAQGEETDRFVQVLAERSAGNWMYLHYVLDEIARGERHPLDLDALPVGLTGYYAEYWQRWRDRDKTAWDTRYVPLLATLGAAQEPLSLDLLLTWSGVERAQRYRIQLLLREQWRAFVYELNVDGQPVYRPYHASLRDFLHGRLDEEQWRHLSLAHERLVQELMDRTRDAHRRIAKSYLADPARWPAHGGYAFRHLTHHLAQAGMVGELAALIENRAWYAASRDHDPSRRLFAEDVARALGLAEAEVLEEKRPDRLPPVVAWSLLHATVRTLATNVPVEALEAMALLDDADRARRYAALITDPEKQTEAYRRIGVRLHEQGNTEQAREALQRALAAAEGIGDADDRARALAAVAQAMAQVGDRAGLQRALATAEGIDRAEHRAEALAAVAQAMAQAMAQVGDRAGLQRALAAAEGIGDAEDRAEALAAVAQAMAQAMAQVGDREGLQRALAAAEGIGGEWSRARALAAVAQAMAQVGDTDKAREALQRALAAAEGIGDAEDRAWALAAVAQAMAQVGDTDKAREALQRALAAAEGVGEEWSRAEALAAAEGIGWEPPRAEALAAVARAMAQVAQPGDAETAKGAVDAFRRAREQGREEVWLYIGAFAPVLAKLGVLGEAWRRIQAVEAVVWGGREGQP